VITLNRSLRESVSRLGLADAAFRLYGVAAQLNPKSIVANARNRRRGAPDGLPIPPSDLIHLVAGSPDVAWFLKAGALGAQTVRAALLNASVRIEDVRAMLDFGCGCGRVMRYWQSLPTTKVSGTDINPRLIEWSRHQLPFAEFAINGLAPPLEYRDGAFDVIYAFSVFTHLTPELQHGWMAELTRVLKPGGLLMFSVHGPHYVDRLSESEREQFAAGHLIVKNNVKSPGSNTCSAYHPPSYVRDRLAANLELVDYVAEGARGNPSQDLYVFRRP
jgi:SAM-dependent methyltransferase